VSTPREQLAEELRAAREGAGIGSQAALAKRMRMSRPVINKAESATERVPSDAVITAWAGITGAPLDPLLALADRARSGIPEWFADYLVAESGATVIRTYAPDIIPGILQDGPYAREVISAVPVEPEKLEETITARLRRAAVLRRAHLAAVIAEEALQRCIGSPVIMADQVAHLAVVAHRPNIAVHVVPFGTNTGAWAALDIASSGGQVTVSYTTAVDDIVTSDAGQCDRAMITFERIMGYALPRAASLDSLVQHEKHWRDKA
jgi:transcriptional regulator with XRE-family HTH domain